MLRFRAIIDGIDKVRSFLKILESMRNFDKENFTITLGSNEMTFFRSSDSVRLENMFEFNINVMDCFTEFLFEMGDSSPEPRLSFNISIVNLFEAFRILGRSDIIKLSIMQQNNIPVLRIRSPSNTAVQDVPIDFHHDFPGPNEYTVPESVQSALIVSISEAIKLSTILTAFRNLENKFLTIKASMNTGRVIFKARTSNEICSTVELRELGIHYKPAQDEEDDHVMVNEVTVTVSLAHMQHFCKTVPSSNQLIELQIVNAVALRIFAHKPEGIFTYYLCNHDLS